MIKRILAISVLLSALAVAAHPTTLPLLQPHQIFVDSSGSPCAGCFLYSYAAGTTTPLATYTDSTGGTPNTNPIILDVTGGANIWTGSSAYKFVLKDAFSNTLWTVDNVQGGAAGVTSVGMTVPSWLSVSGSPVTSVGTLAVTANSQTQNLVLASPAGGSGTPAFRALVAGDLPTALTPTSVKATTFYTSLDFCVNGGSWPSCTACTTAATIDPVNGNNQTVILTAGSTCALTFTQPVGKEVAIQLTVIQSSFAGFNGLISGCTWPGGAGGGVAPIITPSSGAVDVVWAKLDSLHSRCTIGQAFN